MSAAAAISVTSRRQSSCLRRVEYGVPCDASPTGRHTVEIVVRGTQVVRLRPECGRAGDAAARLGAVSCHEGYRLVQDWLRGDESSNKHPLMLALSEAVKATYELRRERSEMSGHPGRPRPYTATEMRAFDIEAAFERMLRGIDFGGGPPTVGFSAAPGEKDPNARTSVHVVIPLPRVVVRRVPNDLYENAWILFVLGEWTSMNSHPETEKILEAARKTIPERLLRAACKAVTGVEDLWWKVTHRPARPAASSARTA